MRTIKFRGKDKRGRWHYGWYWENSRGDCFIKEKRDKAAASEDFEVLPETVGQFTGLKDRKGLDIYEQDIIEYAPYRNSRYKEYGEIGEVFWGETGDSDDFYHSKHYEWVVGEDSLADVADGNYKGFCCEVIGNKFDTPSLLGGAE